MKINNIFVPPLYDLRNNDNQTLILQCDFTVNENDTGFVLKWLFNNAQIYQWIPSKVPFALVSFHISQLIANNSDFS